MIRLRCDIEVDPGALWVADDALGQSIEFDRDGYRVRIRFPDPPAVEGGYEPPRFDGSRQIVKGQPTRRGVRRLLVSVFWEEAGKGDAVTVNAARHVRRAREIARAVVRELVDWMRVEKGQNWLPEHIEDITFTAPGGALNVDTGEALPLVVGDLVFMGERPDGAELDRACIDRLTSHLTRRDEIPMPELLLADASYYTRRLRPAEAQRAILMAAIACELKVKQTLRTCAGDHWPLVELILDNPRDVSVAAANLFHKGMKATTGRSLQEEEAGLHRAVTRLFEVRNRVAHGGAMPDPREARELVIAAAAAFRWLDDVSRAAQPRA